MHLGVAAVTVIVELHVLAVSALRAVQAVNDAGKGKVLAASQPLICVLNAGELLVTQAAAPASLARVPFSNEFE
jgi:hypothetical protein